MRDYLRQSVGSFIAKAKKMEIREAIDLLTDSIRDFIHEENGMGTVEVILIIVVLVGLVIIFKKQITEIVNNLFDGINNKTQQITG